jgi:hypothetical protein
MLVDGQHNHIPSLHCAALNVAENNAHSSEQGKPVDLPSTLHSSPTLHDRKQPCAQNAVEKGFVWLF